jgi:hypothetical protein
MSKSNNMIVIDQVQYILPRGVTEVSLCDRGFLWAEKVDKKSLEPWESTKSLLHKKKDLTPIRPLSTEALKMKTSAMPINKKLKVVECVLCSLKVINN